MSFRNSTDVEEVLGGGSDDAGFVQVMQGRCADRARLQELEAKVMPRLKAARPDVLGGVRAWFGDGYVEAIYFTNEAEARKGEKNMTQSIGDTTFEEFMSLTPDVTYIDLKTPILASA